MKEEKEYTERLVKLIGDIPNRTYADKCGFDEKVVRNIKKGIMPGRTVLEKIAKYHGKTVDYLLNKDDQPAEAVKQFSEHKESKDLTDAVSIMMREKFKRQCGFTYFDDFFDFIAENYGENYEGVSEFFEELSATHTNYRLWQEEKKLGRESHKSRLSQANENNNK